MTSVMVDVLMLRTVQINHCIIFRSVIMSAKLSVFMRSFEVSVCLCGFLFIRSWSC